MASAASVCEVCPNGSFCSSSLEPRDGSGSYPSPYDECVHYTCGWGMRAARLAYRQARDVNTWESFTIETDAGLQDVLATSFETHLKSHPRIVDENRVIYSAMIDDLCCFCPTGQEIALWS